MMRKLIFKMWLIITCVLLTTIPAFAYNTEIRTVTLPSNFYTTLYYGTPQEIGYFTADPGASITGFYNTNNCVVVNTGRSDRKYGNVTIEFRENNPSGTILYREFSTFLNTTNTEISLDIPYVELPYPVSKICVVMIQTVMDVDEIPGFPLNSFTFANNQGGWNTWQIVNTDQVAALTLETVEEARDVANTAATNATNAYNAANTAATMAQNAVNQTWYGGKYGGTAESTADIAGYIRNQQLPGISNKIDNLATTINNIQTPTITKVQGQNGATCTTGSTFTVVISATPSSGTSYRVTCGSFDSGWVSNNTITINSVASGANTATVQVKNAAGTTAQTTFTFFKV